MCVKNLKIRGMKSDNGATWWSKKRWTCGRNLLSASF